MRLAHLTPRARPRLVTGADLAAIALGLLLAAPDAAAIEAIPLILSAAGSSLATYFGLTGFAAFAFRAAFSLVTMGIFGKGSQPSQDTGGGFAVQATGRQQMIRSNVEARRLVYGEVLVSGPLIFAATSPPENNQRLDLVIVLASHPVEEIGAVYFNDELVGDLDADGWVTTGRFTDRAQIIKYTGTQTAADAGLMERHPSKWTADHVGTGVAYMVVKLNWDQDVYPQGIPNVRAVVKGAKVYDPRTLATAYSTNWALVLRDYLTRSFADGGMQAEDDEIDDDLFAAAANICDERVTMSAYTAACTASASTDRLTFTATERRLATGDAVTIATDGTLPTPLAVSTTYYVIRIDATRAKLATTYANALAGTAIDITAAGDGTHTLTHTSQARYTVNGIIDTSRTPQDILRDLMTGAAGVLTYPNGTFAPYPAAWSTPTLTFDEDDLRGPIEVRAAVPRRELFNAVRGTFADPAQFWQPADFPAVRNPLYVGQDAGEEVFRDIELPHTTDTVRAQRLAKIILEKGRQGIVVKLPLKMRGFQLSMWDTVSLDMDAFGWSAKAFRVTGWELAADGIGVDLTLREDTSASYDWSAGEATVADPAPDTGLPSAFTVGVPGVPTITETLYETTGSAGVKARAEMTWTASADAFVVRYEAQFRADGSGDDGWRALASLTLTSARINDIAPGTYDFRVRAINSLDVKSAWTATVSREILGLTAVPGDVSGLTVAPSSGFALVSWTRTTDLDVRIGGKVVIRHSPLTSGAVWENGVVLEEFSGDATTGVCALVTGTYMAKFCDSAGRFSSTAATFVASEGLVTGLSTLSTITESTTFLGTKTNVVVASSTLKLDTTTQIDSVADFDAITDMDGLGTISPTGNYLFNTVYDGTTKAVRRYEADIAVTASDTGDLVDARGEIDDWSNVDGTAIDDCDVTLYAAITDDDPAGVPTWSGWVPFMVAEFNCRAAKFKLEFESGSPNHNIAVSTLAVVVKA